MFRIITRNLTNPRVSLPFASVTMPKLSASLYPEVRRDEKCIENHFGVEIPDPYRWLEDPDSTETGAFVEAQNKVTETYLNRCPNKEQMRQRLKEIWNYERFSCPFRSGQYYYFWLNTGLQNQSVLYRLKDLTDTPTVFLDPNQIDPDGLTSVRTYSFSEEGQYLAYGLSYGGSDWSEVKFKRSDTGELLPDVLNHVKFSSIEWTHDEKGVFYCMFRDHEGKADGTETTSNQNQKLMYHRLGTDQSEDILCYERPDHPTWLFAAEVSVCGRYVFVGIQEGCEPKNQLYYCDLKKTNYQITSPLQLISIVDRFEAVFEYVVNDGSVLTLRTNLDAPMYKLITIDLENPDRKHWKDLIPHDENALLEMANCTNKNNLIVSHLKDVKSSLSVHDLFTGAKVADLDLPLGSVSGITGRKRDTMAFVQFTSFLTPGTVFKCDLTQRPPKLDLFREAKLNGVDLSGFTVRQIFYESKDKTRIPMFIVGPKELNLNGSYPCQLYGYGGFDIAVTPSFSVSRLLLLLHFDGVVAIANIRGGGEYGKRWHDGGRRKLKQNCFDDFQAAAEYLLRERYTCRDKLYIVGGSNGGLLVCACCNQRPDLFGAAIAQVPVCDLLRFHKFTIGHAWVSDYGDPEVEEDFKVLLKYSPLHNVHIPQDPTAHYPALMILTADHDDRVVPLHSFKFISTLQAAMGDRNDPIHCRPLLTRIETKAGHGAGKPTSKMVR
ncbi:Prolyl oligopeptidase [Fasciolopsis buskii]|uniref:Prolyl endopeptidase n=1 Tax=Fasciolopsis buskii TaxID=27845 RepID=A0A8E0S789_9TREM|nr:Prolyl oligopeptidase [Fasciolopsis buski]